MAKIFSRKDATQKKEYLIDGLIAKGTSNLIISKSGAGKSFFCFDMGVSVALGKPFLGLDTKQCRVYIVDEEQTIEDSNTRVTQVMNYHKTEDTTNLITSFREGLSLKTGNLLESVNKINPDVLIIDSLSSISSGLNMNDMNDSMLFANFHRECKNQNLTIITIHHISIHTPLTYNMFLTTEASSLSMCSTAFINAVDAFYILYNPNTHKNINRLLVRPAPKRFSLKYGIFETGMEQTDTTTHFKDLKELEIGLTTDLTDKEEIIVGLFEDKEYLQIKELYDLSGGRVGVNKAYEIAESLKSKKLLDCRNLGNKKNNYFLTDEGKICLENLKKNNGYHDKTI